VEAGEAPSLHAGMKSAWRNSFHIFNMGLVLIVSLIVGMTLTRQSMCAVYQ
jgi:hypothetical protein